MKRRCSICKRKVDSYYSIYGAVYCRKCFPKSEYYKSWQRDLKRKAFPAKILFIISLVLFCLIVVEGLLKILSSFP